MQKETEFTEILDLSRRFIVGRIKNRGYMLVLQRQCVMMVSEN